MECQFAWYGEEICEFCDRKGSVGTTYYPDASSEARYNASAKPDWVDTQPDHEW